MATPDLDRRRRGLNDLESRQLNDCLAGLADGSLIASGAIVRAKLNTSTTSLTGTITAGSQVDIALGAYAFWPALTANGADMALQLDNAASPTADAGNLRIVNGAVSDQDYDIAWRRIDAS